MPNTRNEAQRIAKGWTTKALLLANPAYLFTGFTVNSDQKIDNQIIVPWAAPMAPSELAKRAVYDKMLSGIQRGQGFTSFNWKISFLTFAMVGTLAALYDNTEISQPVTVLNYDEQNNDRYYQCLIAPLSIWISSGTEQPGGFSDITIPFDGGTEIFA